MYVACVQELRESHDEEAFEAAASAAAWKAQVVAEHATTSAAKEVRLPCFPIFTSREFDWSATAMQQAERNSSLEEAAIAAGGWGGAQEADNSHDPSTLVQAALGEEHAAAMAEAAESAAAKEADLLARHAAAMEQVQPCDCLRVNRQTL